MSAENAILQTVCWHCHPFCQFFRKFLILVMVAMVDWKSLSNSLALSFQGLQTLHALYSRTTKIVINCLQESFNMCCLNLRRTSSESKHGSKNCAVRFFPAPKSQRKLQLKFLPLSFFFWKKKEFLNWLYLFFFIFFIFFYFYLLQLKRLDWSYNDRKQTITECTIIMTKTKHSIH